jgi:hypothetical protein
MMKYVDGELVPLNAEDIVQAGIDAQLPPPVIVKTWTPLEFMELFTLEERIAIREFSKADALAEDWLDLLKASQEVRLDDPRPLNGLNYMVLKGVLSQARAEEVLAS